MDVFVNIDRASLELFIIWYIINGITIPKYERSKVCSYIISLNPADIKVDKKETETGNKIRRIEKLTILLILSILNEKYTSNIIEAIWIITDTCRACNSNGLKTLNVSKLGQLISAIELTKMRVKMALNINLIFTLYDSL